jgi:hypothetical protein
MNRKNAIKIFNDSSDVSENYLHLTKVISISSANLIINTIYDEFIKLIDNEIKELEKEIVEGYCDDKTQDKNYEIYNQIDILDKLKEQL